ncbi:hypothetical protein MKEN_00156600 [Mycena kentingensis (nom. inval.)]|nr:hypothetical protein MKEN_00156600 [Mycena kentingensis (nom. inval.)]
MSTNLAIIDDSDARVHYAGNWVTGGAGQEYAQTTHCSQLQGSTASLTFVGTSISVYGTVVGQHTNSSLSFVIDNDASLTGTYTPPATFAGDQHHELLFASPRLSGSGDGDGDEHTLVITQGAVAERCVLYLDFFIYAPTTASAGSEAVVDPYFVDDRDARVVYQPPWNLLGSQQDFMHTSQSTSKKGSTLSFEFDGRGISYYAGITAGNTSLTLITLDDGPTSTFIPSTPSGVISLNNLIYDSGDIKDGKHKLVVEGGGGCGGWEWEWECHPPVGAIVGGVVGAVAVLSFIALGALFCLRRRQRREQDAAGARPEPDMSSYHPHTVPGPSSRRAAATNSQLIAPFTAQGSPHAQHSPQQYTPTAYPYQYESPFADRDASSVAASGSGSGMGSGERDQPASALSPVRRAAVSTNGSTHSGSGSAAGSASAVAASSPPLSPSFILGVHVPGPISGQSPKLAQEARFAGRTKRAGEGGDEGLPGYGS